MKKVKIKRMMAVITGIFLILQMMPMNWAMADDDMDLTGKTDYLEVHGTDYDPSEQASSLKITESDGVTVISPDEDGSYSNIPAGAKIVLDYAFSLNDGNEDNTITYNYTGDEYFTSILPKGLDFATTSGTIVATDTTDGNYDLATWNISGNILKIELTNDKEDTSGKGGAASENHLNKWGKVHIEGTFQALNAGDDTETKITFGSQTIVIRRQPLPMESTLSKSGRYDASTNEITWIVLVTPPQGDPDMAYDGYTLIDEFDDNQAYVADSFIANGESVKDSDASLSVDSANRKILYTFPDTDPDTTGKQTITYKTKPTTFAAENGSSAEYASYSNTVNLKRGEDSAAEEAKASVKLDWISKSGAMAATMDDPTVVKWTVDVTVPGLEGKSISGGTITDKIPSDMELFTDVNHPVQIQFGSSAAANVLNGTNAGEYENSGDILTYRFPTDSQPSAGTTAVLTFYTHVTSAAWSTYLNSNSGISFSNTASLNWTENNTSTEPSDTYTISNGIGGGGLLSKYAEGGTSDYSYSSSDPGTIHWIITVNRNNISIEKACIKDIVKAGQKILIDSTHPLTVTRDKTTTVESITSPASTTNFIYEDTNHFTYNFPGETGDTIASTYTVDYYTQIDGDGIATLYKNEKVPFYNGVTLTRTGTTVSAGGTKSYNSQMIDKGVLTAYDYNARTVQWKVVINRNMLPLTNAVVTDTLPLGMTLLIDTEHPFSVTAAGGGDTGTFSGSDGDTTFDLTLPTSTSDQYTLTYWTLLNEDTLKTQWSGTKDFVNSTSLDADEIGTPITDTEKVSIKNPMISKTYDYVSGNDTIDWSVVINPGQVLLANAVVTDVLNTSLKIDPDSVKLYTVTVNSSTGEASTPSADSLVTSGYTVTQPTSLNSNTLTVALPADTKSAYRLEFSTAILTDDIDFANTVSLSGGATDPAGGATSNQIVVTDLYSSGGSGTNSLTVHKTDSSGNPLSDATFQLLNVNKQPITKNGKPITKTTDSSGDAVFSNLPSWIFYVEEVDPSPGYLIPSDSISGGSRLSGAETISVTNSLAMTDVSIQKKGANGALLSGGTFTLTGKDYASKEVNKTASAVNGVVTFTDVPPNESGEPYIITETAAPKGHSLSSAKISATVDYNSDKNGLDVTVTPDTITDTPVTGTVTFNKKGTGGVSLSGGSFTLSGTDYEGNMVNKTGIAAVSGTVIFLDVPIGSYKITEDDPPAGYLKPSDTNILKAEVTYNSDNTGLKTTVYATSSGSPAVTSYEDTQAFGKIMFTKTNASSGSLLSGGKFTLTGKDYAGNDVNITATSVGGEVAFTGVPLGDDYTIKETTPPSGFQLTDKELKASVKYNADKTAVVTNITPDTLTNNPKSSSEIDYVNIYVKKTDEDGNKLAGAKFTLYDKSGNVVSTAVSNSDGLATFDQVSKGTGYTIKETEAPEGYELNSEVITFDCTSTGKNVFTMKDQKKTILPGSIYILKTDEDGNPLAGAEFTLYADGKIVKSVVSGSDGRAEFTSIPSGSYTISETKAPDGYIIATDSISVDINNGDSINLDFKNKKDTDSLTPLTPTTPETSASGSIKIVKVDENYRPLADAEFTLFDENGEVVNKAVSDKNGFVYFDGLVPGEYSVKETAAPKGYLLCSEPLKFEIKATGSDLSYTLKDASETDDDSDVLGWSDNNSDHGTENSQGTKSNNGTLPKTGGFPITLFMLLVGFILLFTGFILAKPKKWKKH